MENRLESSSNEIHHPVARQALSLFKNAGEKVVVKYQNKQKTIEINRNTLGKLPAYTAKTGRTIDFGGALTFLLSPLPLCFAHPDGTRRITRKSQLMKTILSYCAEMPTFVALSKQNISAYMVDLMALIRTLYKLFQKRMKNCQIAFLKCRHQDTVASILLPMDIRKFHRRIHTHRKEVYLKKF